MKKKMVKLLLNELSLFNKSIEMGTSPELLMKDFYRIDGIMMALNEIGVTVECDMDDVNTIVEKVVIEDKELMYFDNCKFVGVE